MFDLRSYDFQIITFQFFIIIFLIKRKKYWWLIKICRHQHVQLGIVLRTIGLRCLGTMLSLSRKFAHPFLALNSQLFPISICFPNFFTFVLNWISWIFDINRAYRTPICKAKRGGFKDTYADDLLAPVLKVGFYWILLILFPLKFVRRTKSDFFLVCWV